MASPLGFYEAGRHYKETILIPALAEVVTPVDPWALVSEEEIRSATSEAEVAQLARTIGERNIEAIRDSQLVAAMLEGQEVDSGTASEVGFACAAGLRCYGLRSDIRETGDPGATVNLQVEAFILASGGAIVAGLADLIEELGRASTASID